MASQPLAGQRVTLVFWPDETFTCAGCHKPIRGDMIMPEALVGPEDSPDPPTLAQHGATWHEGCARRAGADLSSYDVTADEDDENDENEDNETEDDCE